ncbi:protease inhibitor I42 family protein [Chloroflexota bacterium]
MNLKKFYMVVVAAFVAGIVFVSFSLFSSKADAYVDVSNDDFTNEENTVSREIEISRWSNLLTVSLDSDPTTGYEWEIVDPEKQNIVAVSGDNYKAPLTDGTCGQEVWTFNVLKSGTCLISMEYSQPWEGGIKALHKLDVTVVAQ